MRAEIRIETADERLRPAGSEVERLWCDNSRAAELLGWRPAYAGRDGFRRGLAETVAWFAPASNRAGYRPHVYNV
jgi:dTDP-glucose 4,6-dehydratase